MNKKFSTLVASLLLAATVGTASAVDIPNFVKVAQPETAGDYNAETYYQLTSGQEVLIMEKTDAGFILKLVSYENADLANSLWVIEPSINTDDEGGLSFRFKNKRYGIYLSYNAKDASISTGKTSLTPGNIAVWKWAEALEGGKFSNGATIKATFGAQKDSVVYLNKLTDGTIAAMKQATKNSYSSITLVPKTAGVVRLGVDDLNSMLGMEDYTTGKLKMNFTPETTGENLFTKNAYRAVAAAGTNSYRTGALTAAKAEKAAWVTEIEEYAAAFNKLGTVEEFNKRLAEIKVLETKLTPAGTQNKWLARIDVLEGSGEGSIKEQKQVVEDAINNYNGDNEDLRKALNDLRTILGKLDLAQIAKAANLKATVALGKTHSTLVEKQRDDAEEALASLKEEFDGYVAGFATAQNGFNTSLESLNTAKSDFESALAVANIELSEDIDAILAKYLANAAYVNKVNSLIKKVNEGTTWTYTGIVLNDGWNVAEEGMTISKVNPSRYTVPHVADVRYMTADAYKSYMASFASTQNALADEIKAAIIELQGAIGDYEGQKAEMLRTYTLFNTQWSNFAQAVVAMETAGAKFADLSDGIDAVQEALEQGGRKLALVIELEKAANELQPSLDATYATLLLQRNAAYSDVRTKFTNEGVAVDAIITAYDKEIELYDELVGLKDKTAVSNVNSAKFLQANLNFGYFRYIRIEWEWAVQMYNAWVEEIAYLEAEVSQWVSLKYADNKYLMVDTAYMTQAAGDQYQKFACDKTFKEIKGWSPAAHDINGRINFRFFYFPSQDSLLIESEGGALKKVTTKNWTDMTPEEVKQGQFGNLVMVKVLADTREVTIQRYEIVKGVHNIPTINTRIGFATAASQAIKQIQSGVYLIKNVTTNPDLNGKYAVDNFLYANGLTAQKNQDFQHIPAAQWVVVAENNATTNSIYNRESEDALHLSTNYENVQFYTDAKNNIFTMTGDTLEFVKVTDVTTPELGYLALDKIVGEDADYTYYSFDLINGLATDLSITADNKGNLKVSAEPTYFTVTPVETVEYGYALNNVATQLKRTIYTISLDGKYVNKNVDGMYVLSTTPAYFFFKEFKEDADALCHYALISTTGWDKIGVDYTSTLLVNEDLEDATIDYTTENTATFALTKKEIERYRNVTIKPAYAQFYQADNQESIILCENPENKGAGTTANPSKPTGINFLGQSSNDFSIYVDTAYVRNETKRPQFLLGLRPDFTELEVPCPENSPEHNHPATYIPQTKAEYLVVLNDSLANADAAEKMYKSKEGYTRLAFVDATHRNDSLIIASDNKQIFLGDNARNNVTFQFLYAERPAVEDAEDFYIETQVGAKKGWIKILNAIPVIVDDIKDADIFNVEGGIPPVANDKISTSSISVIAVNGAVIIKGAEGKKVVINNVLGQPIANTVLTSNEATIAAPAGVAVVAVEGEAAVKAIIK